MLQNPMFDTALLRQLVRAGKAGSLCARGVPGGFLLAMREGLDEQFLEAQRGGPRRFKRLDAVAAYLRGIGCNTFEVDIGQWDRSSLDL